MLKKAKGIDGTEFRIANSGDRERIYALRHEIYGTELGQYPENEEGRFIDDLDRSNVYIVAARGRRLLGFVSITPAGSPRLSLDKYLDRADCPFSFDDGLHEIRVLTVIPEFRNGLLAAVLMYAALRWVESRGGRRIAAIGRREVLSLYERVGMSRHGKRFRSGRVEYELMSAPVHHIRATVEARYRPMLEAIRSQMLWNLDLAFLPGQACFHGGAFFAAIGERFDRLERRKEVINADVLDAWFPPAPDALQTLERTLPWLARTSPPADCAGLLEAVGQARNVPARSILPGAGSSDLIYRSFRQWLTAASRVLLPDPCYGEYAHVLEKVIGCRVDRFPILPDDDFLFDQDRWRMGLKDGYDLAVLVNPGNPAGGHTRREVLEPVLREAPGRTRIWLDEAYVDYAGSGQSLERFAATGRRVFVCKSMSKVYALSGMRVAYLVGPAPEVEALRRWTPPWVVGLPAQVAAVKALGAAAYYEDCYRQTARLRSLLAQGLQGLRTATGEPLRVIESPANFVLCSLPSGVTVAELVARCRRRNLFLRDLSGLSHLFGNSWFRVSVKEEPEISTITRVLGDVVSELPVRGSTT